jgi:hypothetical protein
VPAPLSEESGQVARPAPGWASVGGRYYLLALALRLFNANAGTRRLYRAIGNRRNRRRGTTLPEKYFTMTPRMYDTILGAGALRDGNRVLEIGTGWAHWDALVARNHREIRATLQDVWDNRSFARFQSFLVQLTDPGIRWRLGFDDRALPLMQRAAAAPDFAEAYAILGFDYVLDPSGLLGGLNGRSFDLIISRDVAEHIRAEAIGPLCQRSFALLRPGGSAFHQIVLTDHNKVYIPGLHPKAYLGFSRAFHRRWLSNTIQYINLLQVPEWQAAFEAAGFECAAIDRVGSHPLDGLAVHPSWREYSEEDLRCTVVQFLLRKPLA